MRGMAIKNLGPFVGTHHHDIMLNIMSYIRTCIE